MQHMQYSNFNLFLVNFIAFHSWRIEIIYWKFKLKIVFSCKQTERKKVFLLLKFDDSQTEDVLPRLYMYLMRFYCSYFSDKLVDNINMNISFIWSMIIARNKFAVLHRLWQLDYIDLPLEKQKYSEPISIVVAHTIIMNTIKIQYDPAYGGISIRIALVWIPGSNYDTENEAYFIYIFLATIVERSRELYAN